mmetsp:Transcript_35235/g.104931  ORF Transcript_35235/g.104931 Transcript_35235/m.104931 type:complete len:177 (+) Transcript_35235:327-857(+)
MFGVVAVGCTYTHIPRSHTLSRSLALSKTFVCGCHGDYNIKKTPRVQLLVCSFYMLRRAFALEMCRRLRAAPAAARLLSPRTPPSQLQSLSPPTRADAWQVGHQGGDVVSIVALLSPPAHGRAGHQVCARHAGGLPGSVEAGDEPHNLLVAEVLPNTVARQHEKEIALAVARHLRR